RSEHWAPLILSSLEETAEFRSIELSLPLGQIYEGALAPKTGFNTAEFSVLQPGLACNLP
ncbi:hypothetical protein, partial [Escherichia coli]|uniref:hypothetical protein n=1 Tax=Escherichia coli TaxID=562 RepID=UPI0028DDF821